MPYTPYKQATLIVRNDLNFPPIPTIKSPFDTTISAAHLQPFNQFLCGTERFSQFVTLTEMPKGLKAPFQRNHDMQYGLEVIEPDPRTSAVLSASSRFCLKFGRKANPGAKRQRTNNMQVFKAQFFTDVYKSHQYFLACSA